MFYQVWLERQVDVEPRMFGPNLQTNIIEKVKREVRAAACPNPSTVAPCLLARWSNGSEMASSPCRLRARWIPAWATSSLSERCSCWARCAPGYCAKG